MCAFSCANRAQLCARKGPAGLCLSLCETVHSYAPDSGMLGCAFSWPEQCTARRQIVVCWAVPFLIETGHSYAPDSGLMGCAFSSAKQSTAMRQIVAHWARLHHRPETQAPSPKPRLHRIYGSKIKPDRPIIITTTNAIATTICNTHITTYAPDNGMLGCAFSCAKQCTAMRQIVACWAVPFLVRNSAQLCAR